MPFVQAACDRIKDPTPLLLVPMLGVFINTLHCHCTFLVHQLILAILQCSLGNRDLMCLVYNNYCVPILKQIYSIILFHLGPPMYLLVFQPLGTNKLLKSTVYYGNSCTTSAWMVVQCRLLPGTAC